MRFYVEKIKTRGVRNINGKEIECKYRYVIVAKRWFRKRLYLRLLPVCDSPMFMNVQFTYWVNQATSYDNEKEAQCVIADIDKNPNNYRL